MADDEIIQDEAELWAAYERFSAGIRKLQEEYREAVSIVQMKARKRRQEEEGDAE